MLLGVADNTGALVASDSGVSVAEGCCAGGVSGRMLGATTTPVVATGVGAGPETATGPFVAGGAGRLVRCGSRNESPTVIVGSTDVADAGVRLALGGGVGVAVDVSSAIAPAPGGSTAAGTTVFRSFSCLSRSAALATRGSSGGNEMLMLFQPA